MVFGADDESSCEQKSFMLSSSSPLRLRTHQDSRIMPVRGRRFLVDPKRRRSNRRSIVENSRNDAIAGNYIKARRDRRAFTGRTRIMREKQKKQKEKDRDGKIGENQSRSRTFTLSSGREPLRLVKQT